MFDLNGAIGDWRRRLEAQPDIQPADLAELEDHLRESVEDLRSSGLSEEEAFLVAARRLGDPEALGGEFATADPGLRRRLRLRWIMVGAVALLALFLVAEVVVYLSASGLTFLNPGIPALGLVLGLLRLAVFLIGGVLIWRLLTQDSAAGRIGSLATWGAGLLGLFLLLVLAATFLFGGFAGLRHIGAHSIHCPTLPLVGSWFRTGLTVFPLVVMPLVLLLVVIWLVARQGRSSR